MCYFDYSLLPICNTACTMRQLGRTDFNTACMQNRIPYFVAVTLENGCGQVVSIGTGLVVDFHASFLSLSSGSLFCELCRR